MTNQSIMITAFVVGCFLKSMKLGIFKSLGVFFIPIQETLQTTNTVLGAWISMFDVAVDIFAPVAIFATQLFGERPVIIFGAVLNTVALCLASFTASVTLFGIFLFLSGSGICLSFFSFMCVIPKYFSNNINNAFGFVNAVGAVGMMIFPPLAQLWTQQYGWQGGMLLLGAVNANCIVCGLLIPHKMHKDEIKYIEVEQEKSDQNKSSQAFQYIQFSKTLLVENPKLILMVIAEILAGILYTGWVIFLVPHAVTKGISQSVTAFLSSSGAAGVIVGRLIMGPIIESEYLTATQLYIVLSLINAAAFFLDILSWNFVLLAVNAFFNGLATGTLTILSFGVCGEILGEDLVVDGYGLLSMFLPIGDILGGTLLGHYFDKEESQMSFVLLGAVSVLMVVVVSASFLSSCSKANEKDTEK